MLNIYLHTYAFTYILLIMAIIRSDIVCKSKRGQNSILTCHRGYKEEENKGYNSFWRTFSTKNLPSFVGKKI